MTFREEFGHGAERKWLALQ